MKTILLILSISLASFLQAQVVKPPVENSQSSAFSYETYVKAKSDTLKYRQLSPTNPTNLHYPLVIFLHGMGARGNDNKAQLKSGVTNFATDQNKQLYPAYVIAPQCPANARWDNFSKDKNSSLLFMRKDPSKTMLLVIDLIHEMSKKYPIDTNRIYITGLSMGGFGTYDAITRYPNLFAAAVPVCGGGDISLAASIKSIPLWIFHGADDTNVDPSYSLTMIEALTKAGAHPGYSQYPGVEHSSWINAYADPLTLEWLFKQHK